MNGWGRDKIPKKIRTSTRLSASSVRNTLAERETGDVSSKMSNTRRRKLTTTTDTLIYVRE